MRSILLRGIYEKRGFILGWMLGYIALAVLMTVFFPAMSGKDALDSLMASMPEGMQGLIGDLADLQRFDTYIASQLFDIRSSMIVGVMAIILGLSLGIAEEERGELRTLAALPVSRVSILLQRWFVLCIVSLLATLGFAIGLYVSMPFVENATIAHSALWQLIGMTWLVTVVVGTIPFAIGMASGRKSWAMILGILVVVVSYLVSILGAAIEWVSNIGPWTPFYYFPPIAVVKDGIALSDVVVLSGVVAVLILISLLLFRRRDIN